MAVRQSFFKGGSAVACVGVGVRGWSLREPVGGQGFKLRCPQGEPEGQLGGEQLPRWSWGVSSGALQPATSPEAGPGQREVRSARAGKGGDTM